MYAVLGEYIAGVRRRWNVVTCKSRQTPSSVVVIVRKCSFSMCHTEDSLATSVY